MQGCVHEPGLAATAPVCVTDQSLHDSQILAHFKNMLEDQKETVRTQSRPSKKNHEAIMSGGAAVKGFPRTRQIARMGIWSPVAGFSFQDDLSISNLRFWRFNLH